MTEQELVKRILKESLNETGEIKSINNLSGGCIHRSLKVECGEEVYFVKWNKASYEEMFSTEARGLRILMESRAIEVPEVYAYGSTGECSYLVLPFIKRGIPSKNYWADFGLALSDLHKHTQDRFGLSFDNYIGTLPQLNSANDSWIDFFIEKRLAPQIKLARDSGKLSEKEVTGFSQFIKKLPALLIEDRPSLLHGDLWSGNVMISDRGVACLIDPAVYYGHREMEIAFTQLFGGFSEDFYSAYFENFPVEKGFEERSDIYNVYPLLVHLNLFGGGYLNQVLQVIKKYN